jgi:hypothetical protein
MLRRCAVVLVTVVFLGVLTSCIQFGEATTQPVPLTSTQTIGAVLVGDVTGDGRDDVIAGLQTPSYATRGTQILVSCGVTCVAPGTLINGWRPTTVADFDGDGADDVIVSSTSFYNGNARLYFGGPAADGRPAGLAPDDWIGLPASWDYVTGDLDGDDDIDLVQTTTYLTYYLEHRFLRNDGSGAFADAGIIAGSGPLNAGGGGVLVVGDGERDRVYGRWLGQRLDGSLPGGPSSVPADAFAAADVDSDGIDDLLVHDDDSLVTFWRGTGTGFSPFPDYQTIEASFIDRWHVGDLDGDDLADLWLHTSSGPIYLGGTGDGGFPYEPTGTVPAGRVTFGDLDGDGLPEAIGVTADARALEIHPNIASGNGSTGAPTSS